VLDTATVATFEPLVGRSFHLKAGDGAEFDLVLVRCAVTPYGDPRQWQDELARVPFSLLFQAPEDRSIEQQICRLSEPSLGEFDLFLVPLGPAGGGMQYEAVIS
jgi:uncharacterized protein DUF6916